MLGNLFEDEGLPSGPNTSPVRFNNRTPSNVPEHRGLTKLCGLDNLGATCYLNSLIQTLLYTPELRGNLLLLQYYLNFVNIYSKLSLLAVGLMSLDLEPVSDCDNVRVIPLSLQRLFAQLLLHLANHKGKVAEAAKAVSKGLGY